MAKVGVLTFSDGRDFVHEGAGVGAFARDVENDVVGALEAAGHEVVRGRDVWDLCNSGQHATWFAARSAEAAENLRHVHLYPEEFFFPAGGAAAVHHLAAEGDFTFARLTRLDGRYRMHVMRGSFVRYDDDTNENLMRQSTRVWPHAFAKMDAPADEILSRYGSNHIHAIPGDHVEELRTTCRLLDVDYDGFGSAGGSA